MLRTRLTAAVATGAVLVGLCACGNAPAGYAADFGMTYSFFRTFENRIAA